MKIRYIAWTVLSTFFLLFAFTAEAANLTSKQVENYIASIKALNKADLDMDDDDDDYDSETYMKNGPPKLEDMVRSHKNKSELNEAERIVKRHGFKNLIDWAKVGDKTNAAVLSLMFDEENLDLQKELEAAKKELENMPWLSDDQKEAMLGFALGAVNMLNSWVGDVPESDKKVVKPYLEQLIKELEYDN